jgi:hypothetical protein
MKTKHAVFGLIGIAMLVYAPLPTPANALGGIKVHSFHSGKHFRGAHRRNNFNQWPLYGGLYALPPYDSYGGYSSANYFQPEIVFVAQPPAALSCQNSKEIRSVPSESGGTRDITITRC